jgi:hypothetical protein
MKRALLAAALLAGCASDDPAPDPPAAAEAPAAPAASPPAPATPEPAATALPTPFTADQVRDGMPVGTELRFRLEAVGKPDTVSEWSVRGNSADAATIAFRDLSAEGTPAEWVERSSTWTELQAHASFAPGTATRERGTFDTAAGRFEGWRYEVRSTDEGLVVVETYEFADALPGPPVRMTTRRGGEQVQAMVLLRHSRATSGNPNP